MIIIIDPFWRFWVITIADCKNNHTSFIPFQLKKSRKIALLADKTVDALYTSALPSKWDNRSRRLMIAIGCEVSARCDESWNSKCFSTIIVLLLSCHLTPQLRKIVFMLIDSKRWILISRWDNTSCWSRKKRTFAWKLLGGYCKMPHIKKSMHCYFQTCPIRACRFPLPRSCRAIRTDLHGLTTIVSRCLSNVGLCVRSLVN